MKKLLGGLAALLLLSAQAQAQTVVPWLYFPIFGTITAGDCATWHTGNSSGVTPSVADSGAACGTSAFGSLTGGTNTSAAMVVGSGASLGVTGTGTIGATSVTGLSVVSGKTLTVNNSVTLAGTDTTTMTLPATSQTLAGLSTAETWSALQTFGTNISIGGVTAGGATGTGNVVFGTSPSITSPTVATGETLSFITGSTQCLHVNTSGVVSGTGSDCGAGGSTAFSALTSSTNTTAAMVVGTGASLAASGSGTITATAAPVGGLSGLGTGVGTWLATPSSANLASAVTGATGSGALVFGTSPTLTTPALGTPSALVLTNATGTPSSIGLANGTGLPLTGLAAQAADTIACNATSGSASPTACSAAATIGVLNSTAANAQTGTTYTPVLGDANLFITMSNASANTFCIPPNSSVAYAVGTTLTVEQIGAGVTTVAPAGAAGCAGTGVTVTSLQYGSSTSQTYAMAGAYDLLQIRQTATNSWLVTGVGPGRALQAGTANLASTAFGGVANTLPFANGGTGTTGVTSVSTATSITPNCTFGMAKIAASATGTFTINAPGTCTPFDGQKLTLKITSPSGGTVTYSWNATYLASATLALPTTSNAASKEDYFAFQWDADKTGWVFLAANQGF